MATGQDLLQFRPGDNEPPATNYATLDFRNGHPVLAFDTTTSESAIFSAAMPRNYAGGGITVYIHHSGKTATTGTIGWLTAFERIGDGSQDVDADGFATAKTVTAATVPATSGNVDIVNVAHSNAEIDGIAVGELFRLKVSRDTTNDTAAGDAEIHLVQLKET